MIEAQKRGKRIGLRIGLAVGLVIMGTPVVAWFIVRSRIAPKSETNVRRLYNLLVAQDYHRIAEEDLARGSYLDVLSARDQVLGPITSYHVEYTMAGPLVIPLTIKLTTVRHGVEYTEWARVHSNRCHPVFVDMSLTNQAQYKVNAILELSERISDHAPKLTPP